MRLFSNKKNAGYTFIEIVLAITLLAIALPPFLTWFSNLSMTGARAANLPTAVVLGSNLMEEIKSKKFDELVSKDINGNWSTVLGPDTGEVGDKTKFDDVDDFNGWSQGFGSAYPGYTASVVVSYVSSSNLSAPLTMPSQVPITEAQFL
ncbi:MAG: hypothetical protein HY073_02790 [Deltaproteobacteria bacterium]|nr:hypothetical protein [Deltaproteobacteria bacterium]